MNQKLKKLFTLSLIATLFGLVAVRAEAGQRIDSQWIWQVGGDQCIPEDADVRGCEAPVAQCRQEFERLMDGIMYTFCSGANPEICTSLAYRVVEFSNMGYSKWVAPAIDRFFWTDDSVREAFQCISNRKNRLDTATDVVKYRSVELPKTRASSHIYADRLGNAGEWIEKTPEMEPAPVPPPVQDRLPEEDSRGIPEAASEPEVVVPAEVPYGDLLVEDTPADLPDFNQSAATSPNGTFEFSGAGCTLNTTTAPTSWLFSLFAMTVFGIFLPRTRKGYRSK